MSRNAMIVMCLVLATHLPVRAQDSDPLDDFDFMLGDWTGAYETVADVPELGVKKGQSLKIVQKNQRILGGTAIEINVGRIADQAPAGQTKEIVSWDPIGKRLVHAIFGQGLQGGGVWEKEGDTMVLTWEVKGRDDRVYRGQSFCQPIADGAYTWQIRNSSLNGKPLADTPVVKLSPPAASLGPGQEKMKALGFLVGEWATEGADGSRGTISCRYINNNSFLEVRSGDYLEIYGWDPHENRYVGFGFGTHGGLGRFRWSQDGETWSLVADPIFFDRDGIGFPFEVHLKQVDENTIEASGRFGKNHWKETRRRTASGEPTGN